MLSPKPAKITFGSQDSFLGNFYTLNINIVSLDSPSWAEDPQKNHGRAEVILVEDAFVLRWLLNVHISCSSQKPGSRAIACESTKTPRPTYSVARPYAILMRGENE
jgi:hypothetical protein